MAYGYDTRSWRNSTEKRQMDQERHEVTARFVPQVGSVVIGPFCTCGIRPLPHELSVHREALTWEGDWRCLWPRELRREWRRPYERDEITKKEAMI